MATNQQNNDKTLNHSHNSNAPHSLYNNLSTLCCEFRVFCVEFARPKVPIRYGDVVCMYSHCEYVSEITNLLFIYIYELIPFKIYILRIQLIYIYYRLPHQNRVQIPIKIRPRKIYLENLFLYAMIIILLRVS